MEINRCPDCKGELEKGCLIDHTYGGVAVQRYARSEIPDTPNKAVIIIGVTEENFYDVRKTIAYRCTKCNRLFLYALNTITVPNVSKRIKKFLLIITVCTIIFIIIAIVLMTGF